LFEISHRTMVVVVGVPPPNEDQTPAPPKLPAPSVVVLSTTLPVMTQSMSVRFSVDRTPAP
jgi:hypothetical protein